MLPMGSVGQILVLTVVVALTTGSSQASNANHRVTFKNFQHDPSENIEDRLRETLSSLLPNQTVVFESFAKGDVSWHIKEIQQLDGCPLDDIQKLEKVIKGPGSGNTFSRVFKMIMQQYFKLEAVEVEYLGPCAASKQKRSKIMSPLYSAFVSTTTQQPEPPTTTTEQPATTAATLTSTAEQPETTTWNMDRGAANTTASFMGLPRFDDLFNEANISSSGDMKSALFDIFSPTTLSTISTTINSSETSSSGAELPSSSSTLNGTTSLEANSLGAISNSSTTQTSSLTETTSHPSSANLSQATATPGLQSSVSNITDATSSTQPTLDSTTSTHASPNQLTEPSPSSSSSSSSQPQLEPASLSPLYGKYVGLVAAFLIFVAFLICSRAYNRNGMYELHTE